ncbi:MAG TPA: hypothetical protein VK566_01305 [Nitrososphaeraceae archaeon]|nr:hypothetical protein [Nitrososphaeraceae archaeon]
MTVHSTPFFISFFPHFSSFTTSNKIKNNNNNDFNTQYLLARQSGGSIICLH